MSKHFLTASLILTALSAASCASAATQTANPFSSTPESVAVALRSGCLPYLVEGGSIHDRLVGRSARRGVIGGRPAAMLYGHGEVLIQEDGRGGCYLTANAVLPSRQVEDAAKLHETVLNVIPQVASPLTKRSDSGPGLNDPVGEFRQESYCFTLRDKPAWLLISSSAQRHPALQVSIGWDREDICKRPVTTAPRLAPVAPEVAPAVAPIQASPANPDRCRLAREEWARRYPVPPAERTTNYLLDWMDTKFDRFDLNCDGKQTTEEYAATNWAYILTWDQNEDARISEAEWVSGTCSSRLMRPTCAGPARSEFRRYTILTDRKFANEKKYKDAMVRSNYARLDTNKDGILTAAGRGGYQ